MAYITFQDPQVKQILLNNGVGSDGEITYEQAAAVTSIDTWFYHSSITSFDELQYFTGLTSIDMFAFEACSELASITIPDSITVIDSWAFSGCTSLASIDIPDSVTYIGQNAFLGTAWYNSQPNGILYLDNWLLGYKGNKPTGGLVIANDTKGIGYNAFYYCTGLTSVTIPNSVLYINGSAFYHCTGLTTIVIPNSVTSINSSAFSDCSGLVSISVAATNTTYDSRNNCNAIIETATNELIRGCKNSTIPNSVTSIGNSAFDSSTGLTSIVIPDSVTSIGHDAFEACSNLASIDIPDSVTYIGWYAFLRTAWYNNQPNGALYLDNWLLGFKGYQPTGEFVIANGTKGIADVVFYAYTDLTSITIPDSVTSIGGSAFCGCSSLDSVYFNSTTPPTFNNIINNSFLDVPIPINAYVPNASINTYRNTYPYSDPTYFTIIPATPQAEQPVITPSGGTVAPPQIINISSPSSAATVYYTLDGTEPTSASTQYTTPFAINESCTVKAIAYETDVEPSFVTTANFTIVKPSPLPPRPQGNVDGIHIAGITYSGTTRTETRSLTLPTPTSSDNEALVEWEYLINGDPEDLGPLGTKCKVEDTEITIHINFEYNGETYSLDKVIPVTCQVGHVEQKREQLILDNAFGVVTLQDKLNINVKGRIKYTSDNQSAIITDPSGYTLQGFTSNGNFTCDIEGSYFVYNHTLINDYSTTPDPANQVYLSLRNSNNEEVDSYVIQVTYEAGAILDVKADAIRMAVQSGNTYTDGQISGVTNQISQLTITVSGITGTVSDMSTTVSGHTQQISQLQQTSSAITATVSSLSEDVSGNTESISQLQITASGITTTVSGLTNEVSELSQTVSSITINIYDELNEKTGIDVSAGTITFTANNGLYVNDSNNNTRIEISPSSIGAKDSHVWNSNPVTQIAMDGFYSGTQSAHTWNGTNEIELAVSGHVLDVNQMGVQRSSFLTESLNGTDTITNGLYADVGSTLPVRIITPTANNQSFSLSKNNGFVVVKNNSPQRDVQLVLPAAASSVGCRIFVKSMHDTYIKSSEDLYPCGDSIPYSQGTTGINIGNDAYIYLCDGTAWFEFKAI